MKKIVWAEGIFLGQQHLQMWDQQLERYIHLRQQLGSPFAWGIITMTIDLEALTLGRFQLTQVSALFQDGRYIEHHSRDDHELACDLTGPGGVPLSIYLTIPANQHVSGISGYPQRSQASGWEADYRKVEDLYDGNRVKEVLLARPNLMLTTDQNALDSCLSLKIAEVKHQGDGRYQLQEGFIPAICRVGASPTLRQSLERISETLNAKRKQIEAVRADCDGGMAAFAERDPNNHALLRQLNALIPQLRHLRNCPDFHPEQLYRELCLVAGAFCTFQDKTSIDDIPAYNHSDLTRVFSELEKMLGLLLALKTAPAKAHLELVQESPNLLYCHGIPQDLFSRDTFFLEVRFDDDNPNWIVDFARQAKVTAHSSISMVINSALPGVKLIHTQRPPAKLSTRTGCEYFRLEARGDFWATITTEKSLAVYRPYAFSRAEINIVTVEE